MILTPRDVVVAALASAATFGVAFLGVPAAGPAISRSRSSASTSPRASPASPGATSKGRP